MQVEVSGCYFEYLETDLHEDENSNTQIEVSRQFFVQKLSENYGKPCRSLLESVQVIFSNLTLFDFSMLYISNTTDYMY